MYLVTVLHHQEENKMLKLLKKEANLTFTENGAVTLRSTMSNCLDLFASIGALRNAEEEDIVSRFLRAYAEDADLAVKTLFYARDVRGGLGERRVFQTILHWLAINELKTVRKNIGFIAEYGRYDDLLVLIDTPCEADMISFIREQLDQDREALVSGGEVSLLAKWLPSVNASNKESVRKAKRIAHALGMNDATYRKTLVALRDHLKIIENNLRTGEYTFAYEKEPSKALYKYRKAFLRNDEDRYRAFLSKAEADPSILHTGTLTPCDVIAPIVNRSNWRTPFSEEERKSMDVTWNAIENFTGAENALAVVDGSGSMYGGSGQVLPAAVAQSLGIYFAERNTGAFRNHFITFSENPQLVEVKGRDIVEKVRYCMGYNECSNTDLAKTFDLILGTAVRNRLEQSDLPEKLYIISDMEFDYCTGNVGMTNFEYAKNAYAKHGYRLPQVVFWNVASRNIQQPVTRNEQGVILVSGCTPRIFGMISKDTLDPYAYMMDVLSSARYEKIAA